MPKFHVKTTIRLTAEDADNSIFLQEGAVYIGGDHIEITQHEATALMMLHRANLEPADPVAKKLTATFDENLAAAADEQTEA